MLLLLTSLRPFTVHLDTTLSEFTTRYQGHNETIRDGIKFYWRLLVTTTTIYGNNDIVAFLWLSCSKCLPAVPLICKWLCIN